MPDGNTAACVKGGGMWVALCKVAVCKYREAVWRSLCDERDGIVWQVQVLRQCCISLCLYCSSLQVPVWVGGEHCEQANGAMPGLTRLHVRELHAKCLGAARQFVNHICWLNHNSLGEHETPDMLGAEHTVCYLVADVGHCRFVCTR